MTRAIILARFSPRPEGEDCESCETQRAACQKFADDKGWQVVGYEHDDEVSGDAHPKHRPGLRKAIRQLRRGYVLLVFRLDRMARGTRWTEWAYGKVRDKGATVWSVLEGPQGGTDDADLVRQFKGMVSGEERKRISRITKATMLQHQANGRCISSKPPYGKRIGDKVQVTLRSGRTATRRMLVDDPHEQRVLAVIRELHSQGLRARRIAAELTRRGLKPRNGHWSVGTLGKILKRIAPAAAEQQ